MDGGLRGPARLSMCLQGVCRMGVSQGEGHGRAVPRTTGSLELEAWAEELRRWKRNQQPTHSHCPPHHAPAQPSCRDCPGAKVVWSPHSSRVAAVTLLSTAPTGRAALLGALVGPYSPPWSHGGLSRGTRSSRTSVPPPELVRSGRILRHRSLRAGSLRDAWPSGPRASVVPATVLPQGQDLRPAVSRPQQLDLYKQSGHLS